MLRGAASSGDGLSSIAKSGEDFGFDIITPNDHLIVPGGIKAPTHTQTMEFGLVPLL